LNKFKMKRPSVCIVGPGVVGQATGKVFVEKGLRVGFLGVIKEQLDDLKRQGYNAFTNDQIGENYDYDVTMFTVPTPTIKGVIDLNILKQTAIELGKRLKNHKNYHLVVVKSTVPPQTTESLVIPLIEKHSAKTVGKDFGACMNPEYLREVSAYEDTLNPWMTLIGEYDKKSGDMLESVYKGLFSSPLYRCAIKEAEMQKYVHNIFNAAKITYFNEMRQVANYLGIDADKVFKYTAKSCEGMWNPNYGIKDKGPFDGHCLPKDTQAFFHWAYSRKQPMPLLKTAISINNKLTKELGVQEFNYEDNNHVL
jgi:UDPglucose 6-dehydrogenase